MKYSWLILSVVHVLVAAHDSRVGDLYLAEEPYTDWASADVCSAFQGTPCNMRHCVGGRYANELCCCDMKLDRLIPAKPVYVISDIFDQVSKFPDQKVEALPTVTYQEHTASAGLESMIRELGHRFSTQEHKMSELFEKLRHF